MLVTLVEWCEARGLSISAAQMWRHRRSDFPTAAPERRGNAALYELAELDAWFASQESAISGGGMWRAGLEVQRGATGMVAVRAELLLEAELVTVVANVPAESLRTARGRAKVEVEMRRRLAERIAARVVDTASPSYFTSL